MRVTRYPAVALFADSQRTVSPCGQSAWKVFKELLPILSIKGVSIKNPEVLNSYDLVTANNGMICWPGRQITDKLRKLLELKSVVNASPVVRVPVHKN